MRECPYYGVRAKAIESKVIRADGGHKRVVLKVRSSEDRS
jgi:hypothetical protein